VAARHRAALLPGGGLALHQEGRPRAGGAKRGAVEREGGGHQARRQVQRRRLLAGGPGRGSGQLAAAGDGGGAHNRGLHIPCPGSQAASRAGLREPGFTPSNSGSTRTPPAPNAPPLPAAARTTAHGQLARLTWQHGLQCSQVGGPQLLVAALCVRHDARQPQRRAHCSKATRQPLSQPGACSDFGGRRRFRGSWKRVLPPLPAHRRRATRSWGLAPSAPHSHPPTASGGTAAAGQRSRHEAAAVGTNRQPAAQPGRAAAAGMTIRPRSGRCGAAAAAACLTWGRGQTLPGRVLIWLRALERAMGAALVMVVSMASFSSAAAEKEQGGPSRLVRQARASLRKPLRPQRRERMQRGRLHHAAGLHAVLQRRQPPRLAPRQRTVAAGARPVAVVNVCLVGHNRACRRCQARKHGRRGTA
jgi:hypothetical protein